MRSLSEILDDNRYAPEDIPELESKLFFEGDGAGPYLVRFSVLLFLSAVIAAEGVIEDSTATVIGAMIIAPLMTPILATTAGLVMGNATRAWRSFLHVVAGVVGVIAVAALLGALAIHVVDFSTNSQITGRIAPRLIDLIVAVAAGTAAAFATARDDVADSLPGVAISISLVPPLCVVGISLAGAEWTNAWGALLLFLTNFLSILLAGGAVFALFGLGAAATAGESHVNRKRAYRIIAFGLLLVAIPLAAATTKVFRDSIAQTEIRSITDQWLEQNTSDFALRSALVSGGMARILITGPDRPVSFEELGTQIASEVDQVSEVDLRFVPSRDYRYP
jgi:uncharacterized hydrophobic protein (TIGR00271 family)